MLLFSNLIKQILLFVMTVWLWGICLHYSVNGNTKKLLKGFAFTWKSLIVSRLIGSEGVIGNILPSQKCLGLNTKF